MGVSALEQLPRLRPDVPVVIELSSWQLEALIEHGLAPRIAVLTLIAEDHLNTYDGFADYAATKRGITRHQRPGDWLVVNRDDPEAWRAAAETAATVVPFGDGDRGDDGAWLTAEGLLWRWRGVETRWPRAARRRRWRGGTARATRWRRWRRRCWPERTRTPSGAGSRHSGASRTGWRRSPRSTA